MCEADILIEAWSPLDQGGEVLKDDAVQKIADAHDKTPAQVVLRWHLQNGTVVIPKSVTPSRIEENFHVFNFELTAEEMSEITQLNRDRRNGSHPNEMNKRE